MYSFLNLSARTRGQSQNSLVDAVRLGDYTSVAQASSDGYPKFLLPDLDFVGPVRDDVPERTERYPFPFVWRGIAFDPKVISQTNSGSRNSMSGDAFC